MNYAKSSPEDTILAVNSFVKDCADPNPLIRALAVRTMGCIRVHKITEYGLPPCCPIPSSHVPPSPTVPWAASSCTRLQCAVFVLAVAPPVTHCARPFTGCVRRVESGCEPSV
jgi:hypothetical protein